ncbi:hypothetical protein REPUB_Repub16aG0060800 [Reevesia pubescens]
MPSATTLYQSFIEYASNVVKHCSGLPLALHVLGYSLSGKSMIVWKSALEKLEAIPDSKIQKMLKISYDSLEDDHDKNLFLDIACLFVGEDRDYTTMILDGCDFYATVGIENLISRKLPRTIGSLASLEELILFGCSRLDDLSRDLQNMKSLRVLNLDETAIYQSRLWLPWLSMKRSKELGFIWAYLPCFLVKLSVESCRLSNNLMLDDLSSLPSLESLNLSKNPIQSLPMSISSLTKLDELLLTSCTELQVIPKLLILSPLNEIFVALFPLILGFSSLQCLMYLKRCIIFGCEKLIEVEGVFKLEPTEKFEMQQIENLFNIDSIDSNKVQLYNHLSDIKIVATPQVIQECGITSLFVQGSEVPMGFEYHNKGSLLKGGDSLSFTIVPPGLNIREFWRYIWIREQN